MNQEPTIVIAPDTVLPLLRSLQGREAGVPVAELVELVTGEDSTPLAERTMRDVIVELRMRGHPACATPADGYFWGVTEGEVWDTVRNLTRRSLTGLKQASRMTGISIPTLAGQLQLELDEAHYEDDADA